MKALVYEEKKLVHEEKNKLLWGWKVARSSPNRERQVLGEFSARDIAKVADGAGCLKAVACLQVMANPLLVGEFAHSEKLFLFWSTRISRPMGVSRSSPVRVRPLFYYARS